MNLEDIAKKAGVSRSTVSRVVNDDPNVSDKTREKVEAVIRAENFHPNPSARALVTQRTEIVGLVIPTTENIFFTDNSYFPQLLAGLNYGTRSLGYGLLLWLGELTTEDEKLTRRISNHRMMDGVIIASMQGTHPFFDLIPNLRYPIVMIDRPMHYQDRLNYVTVDNVAGAEMAVEHLIRMGRRRIAHVTGNMHIGDAIDRLQGYKNALQRAGLPVEPELIAHGLFTRQSGYDAFRSLLPHKPDAVFAAGDTMAIGVLQAAREARIVVPDDMSVVGFDDIDVAAQAFPSLTTVRQSVQQKGETAARLLIDLIEGRVTGPQRIILPTELVVRQSCGAAVPSTVRPVRAVQSPVIMPEEG